MDEEEEEEEEQAPDVIGRPLTRRFRGRFRHNSQDGQRGYGLLEGGRVLWRMRRGGPW